LVPGRGCVHSTIWPVDSTDRGDERAANPTLNRAIVERRLRRTVRRGQVTDVGHILSLEDEFEKADGSLDWPDLEREYWSTRRPGT
jgi:hypothetical protein